MTGSGQNIIDGVVRSIYEDPLVVGLDSEVVNDAEVPYPIEDGFTVLSITRLFNISDTPKRVEIKATSEHIKFYMWANPTVNKIDGNTRNHVGVCLSPKTES